MVLTSLVAVINNQDLMLFAGLFVHFLLVVQSSSPSSSNDQKSAQEFDSLLAPAEEYVAGDSKPIAVLQFCEDEDLAAWMLQQAASP